MNPLRSLIAIASVCAACAAPELPVEVEVVQAQELLTDVPAQLLLDVRVGVPTAGVEIAVEGDEGLQVTDYAPRLLPATNPQGGSQLFVNLVPKSPGDWQLTVRLGLHMSGDRRTRTVTLPFAVSSPMTVPPPVEALPEPSAHDG
jgi:hypothetical protein